MERNGFPVELAIGLLVLGGLVSLGRSKVMVSETGGVPQTVIEKKESSFEQQTGKERGGKLGGPTMRDIDMPLD